METMGIIFSNIYDSMMGALTEVRTSASIPVGGRYRQIDFILSSMAGSGIRHIGIITKYNYQSLMDHLGSCQEWDLQLNTHGVVFVPPYATGHTGIYRGKLEALHTALPVLESGNQDYVERLLLQKGLRDPETFLDPANNKDPERPELYYMTTAFGLSDYYTYRGELEKSNELLKQIAAMDCYHEAFVYKQTKQEMKARGLC